ncbi:carbamoyl phosphate synthase large subunit [Lederbergia galactosidilytica]|uniref:Carbamoyl phosphate synthase large subunit n=1 Tax=Lederbergia galactosidilytica TaxID=217031 RepID=A0A177ZXG5_9BACI|nr:carbamoyl phosphate synthase large subunit [Lederbergia galactosidilytica]OAK72159.1 carbamoyl phosphate synthase large subunit [Lederbergia galactosidilytica]
MPKRNDIKKVLVIGSGPIMIGQAAEFDYAGTQACLALKEEGIKVVLVNNNPATIMTDEQIANIVYFEPMTVDSVEKVIKKEKPDAILGTLGGQTGLNLTVKLYEEGILQQNNVEVLGTSPESIREGEDREAFRSLMHKLGEPVPESEIIHTVEEAVNFATKIGYPVIIRPAYTLGGGGGGIVSTEKELISVVKKGLEASPITQCLIEKSIAGFKELEFEMIRDNNDTCIAICSMENFDPVGVHTGDSIVIAPQQTLSSDEYATLYGSAVKIIRALKIIGGCNIQFAQDPHSSQYYLIEVNPRLSRSSALASKATGYPIAKMAAKLSLGYQLHELTNPVTGITFASMEPVVDYTVVKMPRWPFDKFLEADRKLGTQMKATGEIMAIDRHLPGALQKAIRSLEMPTLGLEFKDLSNYPIEKLWQSVLLPDDIRLFSILELMRRGISVKEIHDETSIQPFFLENLELLVQMENKIKETNLSEIEKDFYKKVKGLGFSDAWLADTWQTSLKQVRLKQKELGIQPVYNMVDSCAGIYPAAAPYFYSTWKGKGDTFTKKDKPKIAIIGSGPVRIGQGIEFDYCTVHGVLALKKAGYEAILINNNPGTVSTDFQIADRLYFEPLSAEDVLNVLDYEQPDGVIIQLGGQTSINLAQVLEENGIPLLSISQEQIDVLEDRDRFYTLLQELQIPHIPGVSAGNEDELLAKIEAVGYPLLLRPSYVIGGQGMLIIEREEQLQNHLHKIAYPVLLDAYYKGKEMEIDVLSNGHNIYVPGFFEHIEKAGVHSGDSMAVTPPITVSQEDQQKAYHFAKQIAKKLSFKGIFNVQFVVYNDEVYVLEVNPRASRTVPIISKMTGVNLIEECINILIGKDIIQEKPIKQNYYAIKNPIFSTGKLDGVDPILTPEMKSTGEVIAFGHSFNEALTKAINWDGHSIQPDSAIYVDADETDFANIQEILNQYGIAITDAPFNEWLKNSRGSILVSFSETDVSADKRMAASAAQHKVITEMETLIAILKVIKQEIFPPVSLHEWHQIKQKKEKVM